MIERVLRLLAIVLSLLIAGGFCMFAIDELNHASSAQRDELAGSERTDPPAAGERAREKRNSAAREYVDDANDVLLKPFTGVATSGSRWAQRAVPTVIGLLLYGFLIAYLARFMRGRGSSIIPASGRSTRPPASRSASS